jgi:hypothetical protein
MRMFAHLRIWQLLFLLSILCLMFLLSCSRTASPPPGGRVLKNMTAFVGGKFDASGVADIAGTDGVLFVDNGREGQVFWISLDQNGRQVGEIKTLGLGVSIEDIEGITTDGTHFYAHSASLTKKVGVPGAGGVFITNYQTLTDFLLPSRPDSAHACRSSSC